jgi:hypothetical protein
MISLSIYESELDLQKLKQRTKEGEKVYLLSLLLNDNRARGLNKNEVNNILNIETEAQLNAIESPIINENIDCDKKFIEDIERKINNIETSIKSIRKSMQKYSNGGIQHE